MEDIVDDSVLPNLSLAVDGLNTSKDRGKDELIIQPDDDVQDPITPSTTMPVATLDPDQLEVYGWESNLWRKLIGYIGF